MSTETINFEGHTPGPWELRGGKIGLAGDVVHVPKDGEWEAVKRLICAAPALLAERDELRMALEALYKLAAEVSASDDWIDEMEAAHKALARCGKGAQ